MATNLILLPGPTVPSEQAGMHAANCTEREDGARVWCWGIYGYYDAASGELRADGVDDATAADLIAGGRANER